MCPVTKYLFRFATAVEYGHGTTVWKFDSCQYTRRHWHFEDCPPSLNQCRALFSNKKCYRTIGACQIDLLIELRRNFAYVCEIKFRQKISGKMISEVQRKIEVLKKPKKFSIRPILIYECEIDEKDEDDIRDYFDHLIPFRKLTTSAWFEQA